MNHQYYQTAWEYLNCCCFTLSKERFKDILHQDVRLFHQTNDMAPVTAQGKEPIVELFNRYIFENSSDIKVKEINLKALEEGISLRLLVEENKDAGEHMVDRFLFEEITLFQFDETPPHQITSIHTHVKRCPAL